MNHYKHYNDIPLSTKEKLWWTFAGCAFLGIIFGVILGVWWSQSDAFKHKSYGKPGLSSPYLPSGVEAIGLITYGENNDQEDVSRVIRDIGLPNSVAFPNDVAPVLVPKAKMDEVKKLLKDNKITVIDPKEKKNNTLPQLTNKR